MNHVETKAAISNLGLRSRTLCQECQARAVEARAEAARYADTWIDNGPKAREIKAGILADGEADALRAEAMAVRHSERAAAAESGYLLHRVPHETGDREHMGYVQPVLSSAYVHGLVREFIDPR